MLESLNCTHCIYAINDEKHCSYMQLDGHPQPDFTLMGAYRHVVVRPRDLQVGSAADTSTSSSSGSSSSSSSGSSDTAVPSQSIEAWMRHQFQVSVTITAVTVTTVTSTADSLTAWRVSMLCLVLHEQYAKCSSLTHAEIVCIQLSLTRLAVLLNDIALRCYQDC
jgi:hypothetical protein